MTFIEMFKKLNYRKQLYFVYKNNIDSLYKVPPRSEEEFLRRAGLKTIRSMKRWEQTEEYQTLLAKWLEKKYIYDLHEIYMTMLEKSKQGDEKAISAMLKLGKEIQAMNKKTKNNNKDEIELDLD